MQVVKFLKKNLIPSRKKFQVNYMKKITAFVMFVLILAQAVGIAHAFADSSHHSYGHDNTASVVDSTVTAEQSTSPAWEHGNDNCQHSCQSCHFHMVAPSSNSSAMSSTQSGLNVIYDTLLHDTLAFLDTPPPKLV